VHETAFGKVEIPKRDSQMERVHRAHNDESCEIALSETYLPKLNPNRKLLKEEVHPQHHLRTNSLATKHGSNSFAT